MFRLGFDTSPIIYYIERHPSYLTVLRRLFQGVDAGQPEAFGSVVTLTEVLTKPMQQNNFVLQSEYRDLLLHSRHFNLLPIDAGIAERAAELRGQYRVRTPDALQLATAISANCEAFITNDIARRRVTDIRVLVLGDLDV